MIERVGSGTNDAVDMMKLEFKQNSDLSKTGELILHPLNYKHITRQ